MCLDDADEGDGHRSTKRQLKRPKRGRGVGGWYGRRRGKKFDAISESDLIPH